MSQRAPRCWLAPASHCVRAHLRCGGAPGFATPVTDYQPRRNDQQQKTGETSTTPNTAAIGQDILLTKREGDDPQLAQYSFYSDRLNARRADPISTNHMMFTGVLLTALIITSIIVNSMGVAGHLTGHQVGVGNIVLGATACALIFAFVLPFLYCTHRFFQESAADSVGWSAIPKPVASSASDEQTSTHHGASQLHDKYAEITDGLRTEVLRKADAINVRKWVIATLVTSVVLISGIFIASHFAMTGGLSAKDVSWCILSLPVATILGAWLRVRYNR